MQTTMDAEHTAKRRKQYHPGQDSPDLGYGAGTSQAGAGTSHVNAEPARLATKCVGKSLLLITSTVEQRDAAGGVTEVLQVFLEGHHDLKGIFADQVEGNPDLWSIKPEFYTKLAEAHFKNTKQEEVHRYKSISENLSKSTRDELVEHITKLLREWVESQPVDPNTGRKPSSKQPFKFRPIPAFWPEGVTYSSDAVHNRANKMQLTIIADHLVKWKLQQLDLQHFGNAGLAMPPLLPTPSMHDPAPLHVPHDEQDDGRARDHHPHVPPTLGDPSQGVPQDPSAHRLNPRSGPRPGAPPPNPTAAAAAAAAAQVAAAAEASSNAMVMLGLQPHPQDDFSGRPPTSQPLPQYDDPSAAAAVAAAAAAAAGAAADQHARGGAGDQRGMPPSAYGALPLFQADGKELLQHAAAAAAGGGRRLETAGVQSAAQTLAALRRPDQLDELSANPAVAAAVAAAYAAGQASNMMGLLSGMSAGAQPPASPGQQAQQGVAQPQQQQQQQPGVQGQQPPQQQ